MQQEEGWNEVGTPRLVPWTVVYPDDLRGGADDEWCVNYFSTYQVPGIQDVYIRGVAFSLTTKKRNKNDEWIIAVRGSVPRTRGLPPPTAGRAEALLRCYLSLSPWLWSQFTPSQSVYSAHEASGTPVIARSHSGDDDCRMTRKHPPLR